MTDFRCSLASADDGEPLEATAPTETHWLFVEQPAGWEPKVSLQHDRARVQLMRRPGGGPDAASSTGARVFWADLSRAVADVRHGVVASPSEAAALDPADLTSYDAPLWFVCTHGRRDVCCAERGRPVAAALAERWPEQTWETTHLGGHRFAATLLALPSGITLGRLDAATAVTAAESVLAGRLPDAVVVRGRAGRSAVVQAAEAWLRQQPGLPGVGGIGAVSGHDDGGGVVTVRTATGAVRVRVETVPGAPRRQSCGDDKQKSVPTYVCGAE